MFQFFEFLSSVVSWIFTLFQTVFEAVGTFIGFIGEAFVFSVSALEYLPPFCTGALLCILGISLVTMLLSMFIDVG